MEDDGLRTSRCMCVQTVRIKPPSQPQPPMSLIAPNPWCYRILSPGKERSRIVRLIALQVNQAATLLLLLLLSTKRAVVRLDKAGLTRDSGERLAQEGVVARLGSS